MHRFHPFQRPVGGNSVFERSLRPQDSFKSAMISLDNVVQVFHLPVLHRLRADSLRLQLGYCPGQSWCLICINHPRGPGCRIRPQGLGQETLGRRDIALRGEIKVQGLPTGGNSPVEIAPLPADPDVGLIHPPGTGLPVGYLPVPARLLIQLRGVFLHPAVDRGVIDWHTPLGHHFFEIAVAHPVAAVPPHCPQDDVTGEMTTGEDAHGSDYFTPVFLLPQLCNSTPLSIVLFLKVNEWIAQRVTTFWGRQLAGFGAIAAVVVFHIPFVSYPAWWHMSSRGIDSLSREIPWLGTIWTTLCLLFIVVYAIMGFLPRRESGVRDRAEHITNEGAEDSKASKADGSPFKIEGVEQPTAPPPSPSPPHAHGVDEQR